MTIGVEKKEKLLYNIKGYEYIFRKSCCRARQNSLVFGEERQQQVRERF